MVASFYRMSTEPVIANDQTPPSASASRLAGRLRKHERFVSKLVDEHHDLLVYLPPMYEAEPERRFSVLYMQDGQNLFDPETSFIKGNYWRMGETADALIEAGAIEPLIIVGIYNTGDRRIDEYTPVEDRRLGGGQADAYGRMLVEELKPFIDAQYRTLPRSRALRHGGLLARRPGHPLPGFAVSICFLQAGGDVSLGLVAQPGDSQYGRVTSTKT